jgi:hypothetical protein
LTKETVRKVEQYGLERSILCGGEALSLVVGVVLVHVGVQDIADNDGLDVVEQYVHPHQQDRYGEAVANPQYCLVMERVANRNCRNHETGVGENHSPPAQVEVLCP